MTTATTPDLPPGALPAGARADIWTRWHDLQPYRDLYGTPRGVSDREDVLISICAIQLPDGQIDDGTLVEPPQVFLEMDHEAGLSTAQARELARSLNEAADDLDGWVAR